MCLFDVSGLGIIYGCIVARFLARIGFERLADDFVAVNLFAVEGFGKGFVCHFRESVSRHGGYAVTVGYGCLLVVEESGVYPCAQHKRQRVGGIGDCRFVEMLYCFVVFLEVGICECGSNHGVHISRVGFKGFCRAYESESRTSGSKFDVCFGYEVGRSVCPDYCHVDVFGGFVELVEGKACVGKGSIYGRSLACRDFQKIVESFVGSLIVACKIGYVSFDEIQRHLVVGAFKGIIHGIGHGREILFAEGDERLQRTFGI